MWLQNQNLGITSQVFSKSLRKQRTTRYQKKLFTVIYVIAHELVILKQGIKTNNAKFT